MEIGGYLEFERNLGEEYHNGCIKLNTARNCLKYIIEARGIKKIWLSRWNCSAVIDTCRNSGIEIGYFDLDPAFKPVMPSDYNSSDYVYVVNYYGQVSDVCFEHMIMDNVQNFFQKPVIGVDTIFTCRKYFGVTDGAYLYTDAYLSRELDYDESHSRIEYLAGRIEKGSNAFYSLFQRNEDLLNHLPIMKMSLFTENCLRGIDYRKVIEKRNDNYKTLQKNLDPYNLLKLRTPVGPFAYPFYIENGGDLREYLHRKGIFIAKLWPNVVNSAEAELAENILPIPCDQRYSISQMEFITDTIISIVEKRE